LDDQSIKWAGYAISTFIIVIILVLRFRSMRKVRPLKLNRLWVLPAIYGSFAIYIFAQFPPQPRDWLYAGLAFAAGCALGWQRGELMQITVDRESNALTQRASPAAIVFIVAIIVVRMGSRLFMGTEIADGSGLHGSAVMIVDSMVALALGFLATQRIEIYLRAKRLLAGV
jgi:hypothetical protein